MNLRRLKKLIGYLPNLLLPGAIKNTFIGLRAGSAISPRADIYHSSRVKIGKSCLIDACLIDANSKHMPGISIGEGCLIHRNTVLRTVRGAIRLGRNTSIQHFSAIYGLGDTEIGDNVLIASHCAIAVAQHKFDKSNIPIYEQGTVDLDTRIGSNVWIGAHVVVFAGVSIGDGSVIGAGAVVNQDIPPNSIAVGMPARVIRAR